MLACAAWVPPLVDWPPCADALTHNAPRSPHPVHTTARSSLLSPQPPIQLFLCSHAAAGPNPTALAPMPPQVFEYFCERTPRSFVEQRGTSLVWNYKYAGEHIN